MKRIQCVLALLLALLFLSGCGLSYEDLYSLPRASEDYYDLQEALSGIVAEGNTYLAPAAGARQEPVLLVDLDGDGVDEAVAFFRGSGNGAVRVYILSQDNKIYSPAAVLEGAGTAVASVEYADLDGSGNQELLITYQVSETVTQALQVYRYTGGAATTMLTAGCSRYSLSDLDGDSLPEVICLTGGGTDSPAVVECYDWQGEELLRVGEARLRFPYDSLRRAQTGWLQKDTGGILFSGVSPEGNLLTDVFTLRSEGLLELAPEKDILNAAPIHSYYVYPEDLDGDGLIEIPVTRQLPAYDSGSAAQWVVDWYGLDQTGGCEKRMSTYQNFSENWDLELLDAWNEDLTIKALDESPTVSTVTLYQMCPDEAPQEILTIYTLRGADRQIYAAEHSLTTLFGGNETTFAVSLAAAELWEGTATLAQISELFHYPRSSWGEETDSVG